MKYPRVLLAAVLLAMIGVSTFAQKSDRDRGIEFYKAGKEKEAIKSLRKASRQEKFASDPELWNFLGLSQFNTGEFADAITSIEKATELDPKKAVFKINLANAYRIIGRFAEAKRTIQKAIELDSTNPDSFFLRAILYLNERQFDRARSDAETCISLDSNYSAAYSLKADILVNQIGSQVSFGSKLVDELPTLNAAAGTLQSCIARCGNNQLLESQQHRFITLTRFHGYYANGGGTGVSSPGDPGIVPVKILKKTPASYSVAGRQAGIRGTISVYALFESTGRINHVLVLTGLGFGLDEKAIEAAKEIKFTPATRNGTPIDRVVHLEYSFNLY